jgi:hypothetical protein
MAAKQLWAPETQSQESGETMKKLIVMITAIAALTLTASAQNALSLPSGTGVKIKLETTISTVTNKAGDSFSGRVTEPVVIDGQTVIPVGAAIEGHIARLAQQKRVKGVAFIELRPDLLTMPNGEKYDINAVVVDTDPESETTVNDEGRILGDGYDGSDAKETAIGAGGGTVVGALVGGGKGAVIGAVVGTGAAMIRWLSKTKSASLMAGTEITMELSRPMEMSPSSSGK